SPEQIRSSDQVDARTDIWSLGCVLFELLTGTTAFNEPSLMQLSASILEHDPVPLREYVEDAPPELEEVVLRCLEKDVDKRYSNIAELAIALYPFAPRRSRISAERCYHALKNAGLECPEFEVEIQSVFPPPNGDAPAPSSGPGRRTRGAMTGRSLKTSEVRTSAPATIYGEDLPTLRPGRKYKIAGVLALVASAAVGAFLFVQHRAQVALAVSGSAAPMQDTRAAGTPGAKGAVIDLDALTPAVAPASAVSGTAAPSARPRTVSGIRRPPPSAQAAARPSANPRKHDDELDVGY
ncbi:MAG TPA: protein kinase, partial [Polyangiaceae bacterium]|nr:protein kinase [Polyangiaceae bacterium]